MSAQTDPLYPGMTLEAADRDSHDAAEPVIFGFWIFLMSDLLLFAVLFATYAAMSTHGQADAPGPRELFELGSIFIETMLLLGSTFTFGMASLAMKYDQGAGAVVFWMVVTGLLGAGFLGFEISDFYQFAVIEGAPPQASGFLSSFYALVATHGLHVASALVWMVVMFVQIAVFGLSREVKLRIMRLALFWHMLDVVWVGIFTFVFLFGVVQ
ncbi:cytochrome c oxidase subunit 3 [Rhodalgimonas zhirmunskyi]|uniref:Cytochrome bo(3) ubiquinol oxidase subunit 3 n=1 Tax=Rhodalgimonas zhirmunskyi TaxID=2964767 RepID=A0AAJ1U4Q0_9RHOB|nr:cytochrome c oxidase subunit 3 [Rhodoalgimonas zhirmunskyi]MDQ2093646.1 cytochrome c oxidase subunit 3 [Rhodoalgimonas zhirmunskyi]